MCVLESLTRHRMVDGKQVPQYSQEDMQKGFEHFHLNYRFSDDFLKSNRSL